MGQRGDWSAYEWDVELVNTITTDECEEGEIIDHNFFNTSKECVDYVLKYPTPVNNKLEIVLVLDTHDGRSWAYVDMETMTLPEWFEDAAGCETRKVPKRFHLELAKSLL